MEKMSRAERAKQFMPFAALRGYGAEIKDKEKVVSVKKELTEEQAEELSHTVVGLKKGDVIKIVYYASDGYVEKTGAVSLIDFAMGIIRVVKTVIPFSDVYRVEKREK